MIELNTSSSQILIVDEIEESIDYLKNILPKHSVKIIKNETSNDFLIAQSNQVIKEAYITSENKKFIVLAGENFRNEAQNSLLKILEEPPKNVIFFIVTNSKSSLLPTIHSRLPLKSLRKHKKLTRCEFDLKRLDLKDIYIFLKEKQKISKIEAKEFIESLLFTLFEDNISLSKKELELFSKSIKLIELNSKPINVLTTLLLALLHKDKR